MSAISTCKNCSDRHPACHDHCERYKEQVERNEAVKRARRREYFERSVSVDHHRRAGKGAKQIEKMRRGY